MPETHGKSGGTARTAFVALCILGIVWLGYRGVWRGLHGGSDLAIVYGSARAWLVGQNPYDAASVVRAWTDAGGPAGWLPGQTADGRLDSAVFLYPPTTFAAIAPLAVLPWRAALVTWTVLSFLMWAAAAWALAGSAGFRRGSAPWWAVMAGAAWLAPAATSLGVGQLALVTVGLVAVGRYLGEGRGRDGRASAATGALQGVATALKPQVAGLFIVYDAGRGRVARTLWSAAVVAVLTLIGVERMQAAGVPWWSSWRENLRAFTLTSNGDPTRANPIRYQIISLHEPLHSFTDNRGLVRAAVWAIVAGLCAVYFIVDLRRGRERTDTRGELLSLSMVAVVSLMVVYHRFYDAVLLLWPLALAIQLLSRARDARRARSAASVLLALLVLFVAPGAIVLANLADRGLVPAGLSRSAIWNGFIVSHEAWALLAMACVLIWMRWSQRSVAWKPSAAD